MRLAPLLARAAPRPELRERVAAVARDRVVEGPLLDALACAPLLGDGAALALPANAEARARLEILVWEAGVERARGARARPVALGIDDDLRRDDPTAPRTARCAGACSPRAASR